MKNIANKTDGISTLGDDGFNSLMEENENAVLASGQTLDSSNESTPDPDTSQLARSITEASQSAQFYTDGGTADTYVLSAVGSWEQPTAYRNGQAVRFAPGNNNTGASTVNVSSIGVKDLVDASGSALTGGELVAGVEVTIVYNSGSDHFRIAYSQPVTPPSAPTGAVLDFAGASAPSGWLLCYGQPVSRTTYADLFAVVGTTYGVGDGSTTFNLPDLRGRVAAGRDDMGGVGANRITGSSGPANWGDNLGGVSGAQTHTLTAAQMPVHDHPMFTNTGPSNSGSAGAGYIAQLSSASAYTLLHTTNNTANTNMIGNAGSGQEHQNMQPTMIMNKIIKT